MYPATFAYSAPVTLEDALSLLGELGDKGRVLAGGQSLIPMMKLRQASPEHLVDINRIPGLGGIQESNGHLAVGALVRHAGIVDSELMARSSSIVSAAARWISDPLVRNRGTLCGSVAHCDPEGDWNSIMLAVGATVVARSTKGERTIPASAFVVDYFTNSLRPGEMVTEVRIPKDESRAGGAYLKLERKVGDYATVGVATHLRLAVDGTIARAGLALTSVAPHNLQVTEAEQIMTGAKPTPELFAEAGAVAARVCEPEDDVRGPADYKRAVVAEYTKRGFARALEIARQA